MSKCCHGAGVDAKSDVDIITLTSFGYQIAKYTLSGVNLTAERRIDRMYRRTVHEIAMNVERSSIRIDGERCITAEEVSLALSNRGRPRYRLRKQPSARQTM